MKFISSKLSILLWKHMKERSSRIIHSTWEIVCGIMMFVILLLLKLILVEDKKQMSDNVRNVHVVTLAFTPVNELSKMLMLKICSEALNNSTTIQCYSFENETHLEQFLSSDHKFTETDAIIALNFKNLNGKEFPNELIYSMRFSGFPTQNVTKLKDLYYMYDDNSIMSTANNATFFANFQWEIDKSFMRMLSGNMDHELEFKVMSDSSSSVMRVIHSFLVVCTVLGPLPFYLTTHSALVDEKLKGINALLKLSGVKLGIVRLAHLIDTAAFATLYSIIIVILLYTSSTPILKYSSPFIIVFTFILHFFTITSLAFITSTTSQNDQHTAAVAVLVYLMMVLVNMVWVGRKFGTYAHVTVIYILLPHSPCFMFWNNVIALENAGEGTNFKNLHVTQEDYSSTLIVWLLFLFQLTVILIMSWYLDLVKPGVYGVALAWHFIFSVYNERAVDKSIVSPIIDKVNLDVYKGNITVILGTNGSGKTSLMSMTAGMISATKGHVYINGLDIQTRLHDLRSDLAYLPQRDITFDYLTVRENLVFFYYVRLNDVKSSASADVDLMLRSFKLTEKADKYSIELTTGFRRCLQIACALISNAEILVLDEPSLGMDAPMKHRLWDLLLTLRKKKTILMASSCMEEADALGDRIAFLHRGKIKCYASPAFLKATMGADFKLSIRFSDKEDIKHIQNLINKYIKDAKIPDIDETWVTSNERNRVAINLPTQHRYLFSKVFDVMEKNYKALGILSMDVGSSLEQVFLRFIQEDDHLDNSIPLQEYASETLLQGWRLRKQQLFWLIYRVWRHVFTHKYQFIIVQVIVPLVAFITITVASNTGSIYAESMDVEHFAATTVLYSSSDRYRRANDLEPVFRRYPKVKFVSSGDVFREISQKSHDRHHSHVIGIITEGGRTMIYYPLSAASVMPTAVNIFSNMLMSTTVPRSHGGFVNMTFMPMKEGRQFTQPKNLFLCYVWAMWVTFLVIIPLGPLVRLCMDEFYNRVRFNHLLMGCPAYIIWLSKLLAHIVVYLAVVPWSVLFVAKTLDTDETINSWDFLGALFVLLIVFGPAHLLHWYVLSFMLNKKRPVAKMYIVSLCFGLITPIFVYFLSEISNQWPLLLLIFLYVLYFLANFVPAFTFSVGMGKIGKVARNNAFCSLNYDLCPNYMVEDIWVPRKLCCESDGKPYYYFSNFYTGLFELTFLLLQIILYWIILLLLQRRALQPIWSKIMNIPYTYKRPHITENKCHKVKAEEIYVHNKLKEYNCISLEERQRDVEAALAEDIYKYYITGCKNTVHAVKGVSFAVRKGQSLAILGQNGAGKTTTLSVVSGYTVMTSGVVCVNGSFWNKRKREYFTNIAWCTEKGFDDFLSGLQNIQYLAALFGYQSRDTLSVAKRYLQYMGLSRYSDTLFGSYSPGCSHRLAICTALISRPHAVLIDELCTNVDHYTRPLVTRAVRLLMSKEIACIFTEKNMEWKQIDEVCTRLAILDRGELVVIGTVGEIRRNLASGYSAIIKLKVDKCYRSLRGKRSLASSMNQNNLIHCILIDELKTEFSKLFTSSLLVGQHMSTLYFHIKDPCKKLTYSSMYLNLETLMAKFDIIEDYILRETSIDEILCRVSQHLHGDPEQREEAAKILSLE